MHSLQFSITIELVIAMCCSWPFFLQMLRPWQSCPAWVCDMLSMPYPYTRNGCFLCPLFHLASFLGIVLLQVLQKSLPTYDIGMFEQNAMVYLLQQNRHFMDKVYFEHSYCLNCWYKDLDSPKIIPPAFVVHFAGEYHPHCA